MATSKQVRKLESTTQGEVLEVEMAVRDEDGKRIKGNYATKSELSAAQTSLGSASDANTAAIAGLATRVGTAEGNISDNATAISNEATARANAVSSEASTRASADTALGGRIDSEATARADADTALGGRIDSEASTRASADTALGGRIDSLEDSLDEIERVANGAHNTFVVETIKSSNTISTPFGYANDYISNQPDDPQVTLTYNDAIEMAVFTDVTVPEVLLSPATLQSHPDCVLPAVVFIPTGLTAQEKATIAGKIPNKYSALNPQLIEVRIGDNILFKDQDYPDRWISGIDKSKSEYTLSTLEAQKLSLGGITSRLSACESTNNAQGTAISGLQSDVSSLQTTVAGKQNTLTFDNSPTANSNNPVKSGGIHTALAGKQNTLTFDTAPTANSSNPVTSGGVKTALDAMQANLHVQSAVIGSVTIND